MAGAHVERQGVAGPRLLDPRSTAAVLLGAHDWTEAGLGRAPSFLRSAKGLLGYLIDSAGLGLDPALVVDLFDDTASAGEQLARVRDTLDTLLRERRDEGRPVADLLVCYVGHGVTDDHGHLSLLVRRSRRGVEAETSIKAPDLARVLRVAAPQQRRLVLLDCCFSEAAARDFIGQAGSLDQAVAATAAKDLADQHPRRGALLLCSSPTGEVSMGPPNAARTLFTGAVLEVLQEGAAGRSPSLSFADLRDAAYERMLASFGANAPRPVLHQVDAAQGDLTRVPAFPNRAATGAGAPSATGADALAAITSAASPLPDPVRPSARPGPGRRRWLALGGAALLSSALVSLGVLRFVAPGPQPIDPVIPDPPVIGPPQPTTDGARSGEGRGSAASQGVDASRGQAGASVPAARTGGDTAAPPLLVPGETLRLPSFSVQVLEVQRGRAERGGTRIRVAWRITAGRRDVAVDVPDIIRILAAGVPRGVSRTTSTLSGQNATSFYLRAETAEDLVSEFLIPDTTDDLVLRVSDRLGGAAVARRLSPRG